MAELQVISDSIQFRLRHYKRFSSQSGETMERETQVIAMRRVVKDSEGDCEGDDGYDTVREGDEGDNVGDR